MLGLAVVLSIFAFLVVAFFLRTFFFQGARQTGARQAFLILAILPTIFAWFSAHPDPVNTDPEWMLLLIPSIVMSVIFCLIGIVLIIVSVKKQEPWRLLLLATLVSSIPIFIPFIITMMRGNELGS